MPVVIYYVMSVHYECGVILGRVRVTVTCRKVLPKFIIVREAMIEGLLMFCFS